MAGVTKTTNINVTAREIDFVSRFKLEWDHLLDVLGVSHPIKKQPGTALRVLRSNITLESNVGEAQTIPYSEANVTEIPVGDITIEKYLKGVSLEAISKYGYDVAVQKTDDEFRRSLLDKVVGKFYTFLGTGELTNVQTTYQAALAYAQGLVINKWKSMHRTATGTVAFVNILDVYTYLGAASITIQNQFGFNYIKDFMGYNTVFLLADGEIARGMIYATAIDNLVAYYVDPADSDFAKAGLEYRTDGEANLVGFHVEGNYGTAVSDMFAILGITLFAEYIDGIAVVKYEASGSAASLTVTSAAGTEVGDSKIAVTEALHPGSKFMYKAQASTAPTVTYLGTLDSTWKELTSGSDITATNGHKITVAEVNGTNQVIASGNTTVTSKTS